MNGEGKEEGEAREAKGGLGERNSKWDTKDLFALWMHQNQLVWSRLQAIGVLQVAVLAGWGALVSRSSIAAFFVSLLGLALLLLIARAIQCDLAARRNVRMRIPNSETDFPLDPVEKPGKRGRGRSLIYAIVGTLAFVDLTLIVLSWIPCIRRMMH
jgi:hypothetical protein